MTLERTGERLIAECYQSSLDDHVIYLMHLAAYRFAEPYCVGRRVLDYGCGTGYGTAHVAGLATTALGVDVSADAIALAQDQFRRENLRFLPLSSDGLLPAKAGSFDTVLSFQVIEHVCDTDAYVREARRVLAARGRLLVVTPDRTHRLLPLQRPWNRWHVREFTARTLEAVLHRHFPRVEVQQMSGTRDVVNVELRRWRRTKWLTLPATLPIWPDRLRVGLLKLIHALRPKPSGRPTAQRFPYDLSAITIAPDAAPSLNLVAVASLE